jgi:hypothetical protein
MTRIIRPLYEKGDLVVFTGYIPRTFIYWNHRRKWNKLLFDLDCPVSQINNTFLVLEAIPASELFTVYSEQKLSNDDHGYVVISQNDSTKYFVYENELVFLEISNGTI